MHEEVVQLSRQEQRELKRQQKRQQQQDQQHQNNDVQQTENVVPRRDRNNQQRPNRPNRHRDPSVLNENQNTPAPVVVDEKQVKVDVIDAPKHDVMNTALIINVDQGQSEIVALTPERQVERVEPTPAEVAPESTPAPVAEEKAVVAEAKMKLSQLNKLLSHKSNVLAMTHVCVVVSNVRLNKPKLLRHLLRHRKYQLWHNTRLVA